MRHPKLDAIVDCLEKGENFTLTRSQYLKMTGIDIPQDRYYTERRSSVAKKAKEYGYNIHVIPETIEFIKA